ncbi:hypothetical protein QE250_04215 [Chromatiaceae bacterium AAb-1]|nr:hypothetical protein [Chromatiaceae bacterium AAb-1]
MIRKGPIFGILAVLLSVTPNTQASEALFCEHCTSEAIAKQEAAKHTPQLYCHSPSPDEGITVDNQVCYSTQRRVILVNPATKAIYAYYVGHIQANPWNVAVSATSLTAAQRTDYLKVVDFYNDYKNAVIEAEQSLNAAVAARWANRSGFSTASSATECPVNTSLDYLTDPGKMAVLQNTITLQLAAGLKGNISDYFQSGAKINNAGISLAGHGASIGWNTDTKKPVFIKSFDISEIPSSINDTLIFDMDLIGFDPATHIPQILFKVNDASRVASYQINFLKGNFGALTITNACALEKLEKLADVGEFRNPNGTPANFGSGSYGEGNNGNGSGGGGGGVTTCRIDFFQNGQLLYVFRVAC